MNIRINLLPPEIVALQKNKQEKRKILMILGILAVIFICSYGTLFILTQRTQTELEQIHNERIQLDQRVQLYEPYTKALQEIQAIQGIADRALGTPPNWSKLLIDIGINIPDDVWITDMHAIYNGNSGQQIKDNMKADGNQQGNMLEKAINNVTSQENTGRGSNVSQEHQISIQGVALSNYAVADWLSEIRQVSSLSDVRCQFSTDETTESQRQVRFEIQGNILPGPKVRPPVPMAGSVTNG
ncbi:hypothetical protein GJ688_10390 [Heliobacillus mobilis]|uniref:Type IV pilus assembly protein PilN n=1 Tax=Heliobacterium mobile TaxID=28064 RepID=A0A6I3SKS8_HELMO|nr:PilN domain-containing protein [Heliobacterium mobile]MTV49386.1 hypothetical protein [Heliobacterium mobile]